MQKAEEAKRQQLMKEEERRKRKEALDKRRKDKVQVPAPGSGVPRGLGQSKMQPPPVTTQSDATASAPGKPAGLTKVGTYTLVFQTAQEFSERLGTPEAA
jgi:hypothetical protein